MEKLDVVLTEYKALMDEIRNRFSLQLQVYAIYASALLLLYGIVVTQKAYDLIMAIPIFSFGLLLRVLWEQVIIREISVYIHNAIEEKKIPMLVGKISMEYKEKKENDQINYEDIWIGWQHYYKTNKHPLYYKYSLLVLFPMFSVIPSVYYNIRCILALPIDLQTVTKLPFEILVVILIFNFSLGCCMSYKIMKM